MEKLKSVCWDLTSKCNEYCEFCFRDANSKDLTLEDNIKILKKLIEYGVQKITFTGGEASLYEGLWEIISIASNSNIKIHLVTNAKSLNDNFFVNVNKYVDCLTMPLDSINESTQEKMTRNGNHVKNVLNVLQYLLELNNPIDIKINTVVSKINHEDIEYILPILLQYKVKVWKLFQFTSLRYSAKINRNYFELTDNDFDILQNKINNLNKDNDLNIVFQKKACISNSYFVISSNGNILAGNERKQIIAGNVLTDNIEEILSNIDFNFSEHISRKRI